MSDERPICICPRPTAQVEAALDRLTELEKMSVITSEMREHRQFLERQLAVAMAGRMEAAVHNVSLVCPLCQGVQS